MNETIATFRIRRRTAAVFAAMTIGAAAVRADVVRTVVLSSPTEAEVSIAWSFATTPESGLVVRETIPAGWTLAFDAASNPAVSSVRDDGASVAFYVPRSALAGEGGFSYALSGGAAEPALSGVCLLTSLSGPSVSEIVQGTVERAYSASGSQTGGSGAVAGTGVGDFRIVGFRVSAGEHPRATFEWTGSGQRPVAIQWRPELGRAATARRAVCAADGTEESAPSSRATASDGWSTLDVYTPRAARTSVSSAGGEVSAAKSAGPAVFEYTPDVDAPAGFFRLVVTVEE